MLDALKIWIDRLKSGETQKIEGLLPPSFLEIEEKELLFPTPVSVRGEAYLAEEHLVIHLKISAKAKMPCAICNEMVDVPIKIDSFYHTESLEEIPNAVFDCGNPLREALLLELPHYAECREGNCPERAAIAPYLKTSSQSNSKTLFPFAGLDKESNNQSGE